MRKILFALIVAGILVSSAAVAGTTPLTAARKSQAARPKPEPADHLAWLGALPKKLSSHDVFRLTNSVMAKVRSEMGKDFDVHEFRCKTPGQVGPVPKMDAVQAYLRTWPDGTADEKILAKLTAAAAAGNWLARAQLFGVISTVQDASWRQQYRVWQLADWLVEHKVGAVFALFGDGLAASGYFSDQPGIRLTGFDIYASLHHSYPAEYKVGQVLLKEDDETKRRIGEAMIKCATTSLPEYARIFSGDAQKDSDERRELRIDASYPPLLRAARHGNLQAVKEELAKPGTDVNQRTQIGESALSLAIVQEPPQSTIVEALIHAGAKVNGHGPVAGQSQYNGGELLNFAVRAHDLALVRMLVEAGGSPLGEDPDSIHETPLGDAIQGFDADDGPEIFEFLLARSNLQPGSRLSGRLLTSAAEENQAAMLKLIDYGVPPTMTTVIGLASARTWTKTGNDSLFNSVKQLVSRFPNIRAGLKTDEGYRALQRAITSCNFELATHLVDLGINLTGSENTNLMQDLVNSCTWISGAPQPEKTNFETHRRRLLTALAAKHYDINAPSNGQCTAWTANFSGCMLSRDEVLLSDIVSAGGDPILSYSQEQGSALDMAIRQCRPATIKAFLTHLKGRRDDAYRQGLMRALAILNEDRYCDWNADDVKEDIRTALATIGEKR